MDKRAEINYNVFYDVVFLSMFLYRSVYYYLLLTYTNIALIVDYELRRLVPIYTIVARYFFIVEVIKKLNAIK